MAKTNAKANIAELFGIAPGAVINEPDTQAAWIERERLEPNPRQPRKRFNEDSLRELGENLKAVGQIEPITVRLHPQAVSDPAKAGHYQIVAGERRWRASAPPYGDLPRLRCIIRNLNDVECLTIALSENANRADISPIEYAQGLVDLKNNAPGCTWDSVIAAINIARRRLFQLTGLLDLDERDKEKIDSGQWNEKHGRALLELKGDEAKQKTLRLIIEKEGLSGNEAMRRAKSLRDMGRPLARPETPPSTSSEMASADHKAIATPSATPNNPKPMPAARGTGFDVGQSSDFQSSSAALRPAFAVQQNITRGISFVAEAVRLGHAARHSGQLSADEKREIKADIALLKSHIIDLEAAL